MTRYRVVIDCQPAPCDGQTLPAETIIFTETRGPYAYIRAEWYAALVNGRVEPA